jgi:hypothetical protein
MNIIIIILACFFGILLLNFLATININICSCYKMLTVIFCEIKKLNEKRL